MKVTEEQKSKLEGKFRWVLPEKLFGDAGVDINDFEMNNYNYFLDKVKSLADLIEGLNHLSPLADDALTVAEKMAEEDFRKFKKSLAYERRAYENESISSSKMPKKYRPLLIPQRFVPAILLAEECVAPLGTSLLRIIELEDELNVSCTGKGYF